MANINKNFNEIAIAGSVDPDTLSLPSLFMLEVLPELSNNYVVDYFYPERNFRNYEQVNVRNIYNIHQLPLVLKDSSYSIIIYHLDNSTNSYLLKWFAMHYPGIIILHDNSLFKLEVSSLTYGTDSHELNKLVKNVYGDKAIKIGDQHINGRSLDIYSEIYSFIEPIAEKSVGLISFNSIDNPKDESPCPVYTLNRPFNRSRELLRKDSGETQKNEIRKFLIQIETSYSPTALEFLKKYIYPVPVSNYPYFYLLEYDVSLNKFISISHFDESVFFNEISCLSGMIILGSSSGIGMSFYALAAIANEIPVSCECKGEYRLLDDPFIIYHDKIDTIDLIINSILDIGNLKAPENSSVASTRKDKSAEEFLKIIKELENISTEKLRDARKSILLKQNEILNLYEDSWHEAASCCGYENKIMKSKLEDHFLEVRKFFNVLPENFSDHNN